MNKSVLDQLGKTPRSSFQPISLDWRNPLVQELLNVVVSILAEEYVQIAKDNSEIFSNQGGQK